MKKTLTIWSFLFSFVLMIQAAPPLRHRFLLRQGDGSRVSVEKRGDVDLSFYTADDGTILLKENDGSFYYAKWSGSKLVSTSVLAHNRAERSAEEQLFVSRLSETYDTDDWKQTSFHKIPRKAFSKTPNGYTIYGQEANGSVPNLGHVKIPVIMVDFPDLPFDRATTEEKVTRFFNEQGYHDEEGAVGSVRDYFKDQSLNMLDPEFTVVAKVTSENSYKQYAYSKGASYTRKLVVDLLDKLKDEVDFSEFTYTDGRIPLVAIYYAGEGAHSSWAADANDHIWAHYSSMTNVKVNDIPVSSYLASNEMIPVYQRDEDGRYVEDEDGYFIISERIPDGIGIFCHEFGHALGLPDFYYTGRNSTINDTILTMDFWSIMDYGMYYNDGFAPIGFNAYERAMMGWQQITELSDKDYNSLYSFNEGDDDHVSCYMMSNPNNASEYFLLENRQNGTWYPEDMGSGLLMLHIDYDDSSWNSNNVNNDPSHQRFTYVPANSKKYGVNSNSYWTDCPKTLFPGTKNITSFVPDNVGEWGLFWTTSEGEREKLQTSLYDIHVVDGVVRFSFDNSEVTEVKQVSKNFQEGTYYSLDGRKLLQKPSSGFYIDRSGGETKKILVK